MQISQLLKVTLMLAAVAVVSCQESRHFPEDYQTLHGQDSLQAGKVSRSGLRMENGVPILNLNNLPASYDIMPDELERFTELDESDVDNEEGNIPDAIEKRYSEFLGGRRKRYSEFLGGKRKRYSEFLGGKRKRYSEFLGGKKRYSEFLGGKKRYSEWLGGKRAAASPADDNGRLGARNQAPRKNYYLYLPH